MVCQYTQQDGVVYCEHIQPSSKIKLSTEHKLLFCHFLLYLEYNVNLSKCKIVRGWRRTNSPQFDVEEFYDDWGYDYIANTYKILY